MKESDFILELEKKAITQKKLMSTEILPNWAMGVGDWLVTNPWRVVGPIAIIVYGIWRLAYGIAGREYVLGLFGGFVR